MEINFLTSAKELRAWLKKNHAKAALLDVGIYKKGINKNSLTSQEVFVQCMCFGWTVTALRNIDHISYRLQIAKRKKNSAWSANAVNLYKKLKKDGFMQKAGILAFESRNKKKSKVKPSKLSPKELKTFKSNKAAWEFFNKQTPSYKHYTTWWVTSAVRPETKEKRLSELINDSAEGTKLKRILAAEQKYAKRNHEPGKTPIESAKNIGMVSGMELRSIGIDTLEKLKQLGWEKALEKLSEAYPQRLNLNMATSLIGAIEDQRRQKIDPHLKAEAKSFLREIIHRVSF